MGSGRDERDCRGLRCGCDGRGCRRWGIWYLDFGECEGKSGDWRFIMDGRGIRSLRNRSNGRGLVGGVTYDGINQMKEKTHGSKAKPTRGFKLRKTPKTFLVLG